MLRASWDHTVLPAISTSLHHARITFCDGWEERRTVWVRRKDVRRSEYHVKYLGLMLPQLVYSLYDHLHQLHSLLSYDPVWLVQLVKSFAAPIDACSLMCAEGPGSISAADNLDSGFHPSGVGKINRSQCVDGWPLQKTTELKRACGLYAASGQRRTYTARGFPLRLARAPWNWKWRCLSFKALWKCSSST